jgi:acyl-CoA thioester hydrolase
LGNKSMTFDQNIINSENSEVLASAQVVLVAFDYHTNATIPLPDIWRERISQYEKGP